MLDPMLTFLPIIRWLFLTPPGAMMRDVVWAFPVVEMVHLLGLVMLLGSILVLDLRACWALGCASDPSRIWRQRSIPGWGSAWASW